LPSERELSGRLGVSRASVREALTALEVMGILDVRPGDGTFVRETNQSSIIEPLAWVLAVERNSIAQLMEVRRILEVAAAGLAAVRATEFQLVNIAEVLQTMQEAAGQREPVAYDLKFHFAIAKATQNSVLLRIMNTVADIMHQNFREQRHRLYSSPGVAVRVIQEHTAILTAIRERDVDRACQAMVEHLNNVEAGLVATGPAGNNSE
ncbi:MAG: FadR/GntR family transcriptional regulator, partial [Heliobacteriaceae bacterium]|nr:FadR/GntR family transcriptional regulator [Heliobacteriaceae bacterium]